jgi:hypothetical protein
MYHTPPDRLAIVVDDILASAGRLIHRAGFSIYKQAAANDLISHAQISLIERQPQSLLSYASI